MFAHMDGIDNDGPGAAIVLFKHLAARLRSGAVH
jgi:hypothetical protein